ncbi:MAG: CoA transferase [Subtercola sp.]|nr:CoA transferase [Subtercola sp.]
MQTELSCAHEQIQEYTVADRFDSAESSTAGALSGIRVVDFTANAAGPAATMLLADFGAEVIKIESPGGDSTRRWGAVRLGDEGVTPTFLSMNRNKSSVVLDLKSDPHDRRAVEELIATADVVIESFAPGTADRLGIGYERLSSMRPELVYCSVSGFGQTGPLSVRPGFDMLMQAFCGHMSITGEDGRPSVRNGPSAIDLLTGAFAAFGILTALRSRDATGRGQRVDASLFDTAVYLVSNHLTEYLATDVVPSKFGSHFPLMAPYGIFAGEDREFYLGVSSDQMWQRFTSAANLAIGQDPRFETNAGRLAHRDELDPELTRLFREKPAAYWVELAIGLGVPTSLVHTLDEVAAHPQTRARDLLVDSGVEGVKTVGIPLKLSETPGVALRPAPRLDEHRAVVFADDRFSKEPLS